MQQRIKLKPPGDDRRLRPEQAAGAIAIWMACLCAARAWNCCARSGGDHGERDTRPSA
jgi:hypothetical protein